MTSSPTTDSGCRAASVQLNTISDDEIKAGKPLVAEAKRADSGDELAKGDVLLQSGLITIWQPVGDRVTFRLDKTVTDIAMVSYTDYVLHGVHGPCTPPRPGMMPATFIDDGTPQAKFMHQAMRLLPHKPIPVHVGWTGYCNSGDRATMRALVAIKEYTIHHYPKFQQVESDLINLFQQVCRGLAGQGTMWRQAQLEDGRWVAQLGTKLVFQRVAASTVIAVADLAVSLYWRYPEASTFQELTNLLEQWVEDMALE